MAKGKARFPGVRPVRDDEEAYLREYDPSVYPRPAVTVDIVVFTLIDALLHVLLVERGEFPFHGAWALPGGFVRVGPEPVKGVRSVDQGEDLDDAAARELAEETGLPSGSVYLEQLRAFGAPRRDPRLRVISVAYVALVRPTLAPFVRAGGDARASRFWLVEDALVAPLAFDHAAILEYALRRVRADLDHTSVAFELVPETFTIPELRSVHEAVRGEPLDAGNFRKRVLRMMDDGLILPSPGKRVTGGKPAQVYRFAPRRRTL